MWNSRVSLMRVSKGILTVIFNLIKSGNLSLTVNVHYDRTKSRNLRAQQNRIVIETGTSLIVALNVKIRIQ